jgi:hypothetical protein
MQQAEQGQPRPATTREIMSEPLSGMVHSLKPLSAKPGSPPRLCRICSRYASSAPGNGKLARQSAPTRAPTAAAGMPYAPNMRVDWPGMSAFLRVGDEVFTPTPPSAAASRSCTRLELPRPHRVGPPGGMGGTEGPRHTPWPARRRPQRAPPRRIRRSLGPAVLPADKRMWRWSRC